MPSRSCFIPKTFVGKPLELGARIFGYLMILIMIIWIISASIQFTYLHRWLDIESNTGRNTYGLVLMSVVYCGFMLAFTIWFLISGLIKRKPSVVIGYVAISALWLALTMCYLVILIFLYAWTVSLGTWLASLILGLVAICILTYGLLVVVGFWYELKYEKETILPSKDAIMKAMKS